ncbi:oligosaccharide flippase family protein, partial [Patescibacteria group bacterium]|nr:oligosaccharide flippase family protein [Patescibacteria group bacterium]
MYSYLKFAKQTILISVLNVLGMIQGLVFLPIITKILGAESYGIWTQLRITISLLVPFTFFGLCESLRRFLPGEKDGKKIQEGVYSSLVLVSGVTLIMAISIIIFSGPVAAFFRFDPIFIKLLSLIIIFESLSTVLLTIVLSRREIEKYFWFAVSKMFGETGLIIGAILFGYGLYGVVFSFLIIRIVIFLILFGYIIKKIGIRIPNFSLIRNYLRFGLPTIADGISYWVITSVDRYIIGFSLGILFVGYYAPAYSLGMLLVFFIVPVMSVLPVVLPKFFDENNLNEVKKYLSYSLKYFLLIMTPAAFGLSILSRQLLAIFSTKEIATNAYLVVPFIAIKNTKS